MEKPEDFRGFTGNFLRIQPKIVDDRALAKNIPTFAGMFFVLDLFYYFSLSGLMERPAFFAFGGF